MPTAEQAFLQLGPQRNASMKKVIFSCEHGGNDIPKAYLHLFKGSGETLSSHRGWDIGALSVAQLLSAELHYPLFFATTTRLLVELNRSLHHPDLFSAYTKEVSSDEKEKILDVYYFPYRNEVEKAIEDNIGKYGEVIHISVHSFTPELGGKKRNADIGLLYDPASKSEKNFCLEWKAALSKMSRLNVRFNYPYRGTADGFTTYLRKKLYRGYSGIELEINQKWLADAEGIAEMSGLLAESLSKMLEGAQEHTR